MNNNLLLNYLLSTMMLLACSLTTAQIQLQPANINSRVSQTANNGMCIPESIRELIRSQLQNEVKEALNRSIIYGLVRSFPADSCADIYQGHPSGYYWLNVSNEPQLIYCSLNENNCCNNSNEKWMRIAFLNMSDPSTQCPDGWREVESPIRTCRRQFQTSISSVSYSSYGIPYSRVCGRIIAYRFGTPEAFLGYIGQGQHSLEHRYVDGISITYGHPRNHIWTFAAARIQNKAPNLICPCSGSNIQIEVPPFINDNYFCELGTSASGNPGFVESNPLWDGQDCTGSSTCCEFNNPPWFCQQLPEPTTEDIEIRLLGSVGGNNIIENEDTPVELIEIFVQ